MTTDTCWISFEFGECDEGLIARAVMAGIDQLCAEADTDIDVLDAVEFPIQETFAILCEYGVDAVEIGIDGTSQLSVEVRLRSIPRRHLGDFNDVVEAFFDVVVETSPPRVALVGSVS